MSIKEALESLFTGECDIYGFEDITEDGITRQEEVLLHTSICRLSYNKKYSGQREGVQTPTFAEAEQVIRLFLPTDFVVPEGSRIVVRQNGIEREYRSSGSAAVYSNHQEVALAAAKRYS